MNIDPKKRLTVKELLRNEWIRGDKQSTEALQTPKLLSNPNDSTYCNLNHNIHKTFDAYYTAEKNGLLNAIKLRDVFEAPIAQRRRNKRSTSSNASSESNMSTNSMCSSLSTSTTSMNTTMTTPTKRCPLSCGKISELTVFNFTETYVNEYLKQQSTQQLFHRPITRSITHNNKINMINDPMSINSTLQVNNQTSTPIPQFQVPITPLHLPPIKMQNPLKRELAECNDDYDHDDTHIDNGSTTPTLGPIPPMHKRFKRCSTILIE